MQSASKNNLPVFEKKRGVTIVSLPSEGFIKPMEVQRVGEIIEKEIEAAPPRHDFLLSFRQVQYISSLFVGQLMGFYKRLAAKQSKLMLCDMHPQLATVIRLSRLERQMPIYPDRAQAITGRTPALTGVITATAIAALAGVALTAKLLNQSHESVPKTLAAILLLLHLPLPVLAWYYRRRFSSLTPRVQWSLVAGSGLLLIAALLIAIL